MELASVNMARSVWLFDTQEMNPRGTSIYPDLFVKLAKRYQFRKVPKLEDLENGKDRKFSNGLFDFGESRIDVAFELWNDGLIADSRHSTEASDAFLWDFVGWHESEMRVQLRTDSVKKRIYRSELVVYASHSLAGICDKLAVFGQKLSDHFSEPQELSAVVFGSESRNPAFTFERRIGTQYSENKFFSAATMETGKHLALLLDFEKMLEESLANHEGGAS